MTQNKNVTEIVMNGAKNVYCKLVNNDIIEDNSTKTSIVIKIGKL